MLKKKWFRILMVSVLVLGMTGFVFGCSSGGSAEKKTDTTVSGSPSTIPEVGKDNAIYNFYNKVQINQAKADIQAALGVEPQVDADGSYVYLDPSTGYAVNVFYSAGDLATTKVMIPAPGGSEMVALSNSNVTESQVASITEGMTYDEVQKILGGQGLELFRMVHPAQKNTQVIGLAWINSDWSMINVNFDSSTGKVISAEFKTALL